MKFLIGGVVLGSLVFSGCDNGPRSPRLAVNADKSSQSAQAEPPAPPVAHNIATKAPPDFHYQGHTVKQWAEQLRSKDVDELRTAAESLRIIGPAGRPYLIQGLYSSYPETRRVCLENLSVSDLRVYGEQGQNLLLKLSGDPRDCRIRERSTLYLTQWSSTVPGRP